MFTPGVLPKYLRKTESIEDMIPWLYLKGNSHLSSVRDAVPHDFSLNTTDGGNHPVASSEGLSSTGQVWGDH